MLGRDTDAIVLEGEMPVGSMPVMRLVVIFARMCLSCGPAIFCRASLIRRMPKINKPSEPSSCSATIR